MPDAPIPAPGAYRDSCGTVYLATLHPRTGWWIQKRTALRGRPPEPFQKPDFPAAVNAKIFVYSPESI